jgi:hypothetical protein
MAAATIGLKPARQVPITTDPGMYIANRKQASNITSEITQLAQNGVTKSECRYGALISVALAVALLVIVSHGTGAIILGCILLAAAAYMVMKGQHADGIVDKAQVTALEDIVGAVPKPRNNSFIARIMGAALGEEPEVRGRGRRDRDDVSSRDASPAPRRSRRGADKAPAPVRPVATRTSESDVDPFAVEI